MQGEFTHVQIIVVHKCPAGDGFYKAVFCRRSQYASALMTLAQSTAFCFRTGDRSFLKGFCFLFHDSLFHRHGNLRRRYLVGQGIPARICREHIAAFHTAVIGRGAAPGHGDLLRCCVYCYTAVTVRIRGTGIFSDRGLIRYPVYLRCQLSRQVKLRLFGTCWNGLRFYGVRKHFKGRNGPVLRSLIFRHCHCRELRHHQCCG